MHPRLLRRLKEFALDRDVEAAVGAKGAGLLTLPETWTPPTLVVAPELFDSWRRDLPNRARSQLRTSLEQAGLARALRELVSDEHAGRIIVRSSAHAETIDARGLYESSTCMATVDDCIRVIENIFSQANDAVEEVAGALELALLVQPHKMPLSAGHLSNERRLCRRRTDWVCEIEGLEGFSGLTSELHVPIERDLLPAPLVCVDEPALEECLRHVASHLADRARRIHTEWVWSGERLWLVQADEEVDASGVRPGSRWAAGNPPGCRVESPSSILVTANETHGSWPKIDCTKEFTAVGLPAPPVVVLDDRDAIGGLIRGGVDARLASDLRAIAVRPVVVRTDLDAKFSSEDRELLPRTNVVKNDDAIAAFMADEARRLTQKGFAPGDFCFILHQFMASRSCAWSYGKPGSPNIRVDSSWGIPDGLAWCPHDSFEFDCIQRKRVSQRLRSKATYIDADEEGRFVTTHAGKPWDWRTSITPDELVAIADGTAALVKHRERPTAVMWFIDNSTMSDETAPWLAWFSTSDVVEPAANATSVPALPRTAVILRDFDDLTMLRDELEDSDSRSRVVLLSPRAELIRSIDFIEAVAALAVEKHLIVEIEGSSLSHPYYMLRRRQVDVASVDLMPAPEAPPHLHDKLVRDLVPSLIRSRGERVRAYRAREGEVIDLLLRKAIEEAFELRAAGDSAKQREELADLLEVIQAIAARLGTDLDEVLIDADKKRETRGGFDQGLILLDTQLRPLFDRSKREELGQRIPGMELGEEEGRDDRHLYQRVTRQAIALEDGGLRISLVPPNVGRRGQLGTRTNPLRLRVDGIDRWIVLYYEANSAVLEFRQEDEHDVADNQLELFPRGAGQEV